MEMATIVRGEIMVPEDILILKGDIERYEETAENKRHDDSIEDARFSAYKSRLVNRKMRVKATRKRKWLYALRYPSAKNINRHRKYPEVKKDIDIWLKNQDRRHPNSKRYQRVKINKYLEE